jgi:hypothetical protein
LFTGGQHSADCGRSDGDANFSRENFEGNSPNRAQTDVHHLTLTERNVNLRNTVNLRRLGWHLLDTFYLIIARQALAVSENHTGNHFRPEKQQQRPLLAQNKNIPRAPGVGQPDNTNIASGKIAKIFLSPRFFPRDQIGSGSCKQHRPIR